MPRSLPSSETTESRALRTREKKAHALPTSESRRETLKGLALTRRLRAAAERHEAGLMGEDVTELSSADFIARLRR